MIEGAEARGALGPGMRVVEYTGRSTGSSLAMVCAAKGYRFIALSSDAFAREKLQTMATFGAEVRIVPSDSGKVTPALFERFKEQIKVLAGRAGAAAQSRRQRRPDRGAGAVELAGVDAGTRRRTQRRRHRDRQRAAAHD